MGSLSQGGIAGELPQGGIAASTEAIDDGVAQTDARIIVYTCVTANYDTFVPTVEPRANCEYICFTNDPTLIAPGWKLRPLRSPPDVVEPRLIARYHKLFAHCLFPDCRWSVWIDGNVYCGIALEKTINALKQSGLSIAALKHPAGRDVGEEFDACWRYNRYLRRDKWRAFAQLRHYEKQGFPLHTPITENRILVRDHHHPMLPAMMMLAWAMLTKYTSRDQLSLQYCLWRTSESLLLLDSIGGISSDLLTVYPHACRPIGFITRVRSRLSQLRRLSPRRLLLRWRVEVARTVIAHCLSSTTSVAPLGDSSISALG